MAESSGRRNGRPAQGGRTEIKPCRFPMATRKRQPGRAAAFAFHTAIPDRGRRTVSATSPRKEPSATEPYDTSPFPIPYFIPASGFSLVSGILVRGPLRRKRFRARNRPAVRPAFADRDRRTEKIRLRTYSIHGNTIALHYLSMLTLFHERMLSHGVPVSHRPGKKRKRKRTEPPRVKNSIDLTKFATE